MKRSLLPARFDIKRPNYQKKTHKHNMLPPCTLRTEFQKKHPLFEISAARAAIRSATGAQIQQSVYSFMTRRRIVDMRLYALWPDMSTIVCVVCLATVVTALCKREADLFSVVKRPFALDSCSSTFVARTSFFPTSDCGSAAGLTSSSTSRLLLLAELGRLNCGSDVACIDSALATSPPSLSSKKAKPPMARLQWQLLSETRKK